MSDDRNPNYPINYETMQTPFCGYGNLGLNMDELYNSQIPQHFEIMKCPRCRKDFECAFPYYTEYCSECALDSKNHKYPL